MGERACSGRTAAAWMLLLLACTRVHAAADPDLVRAVRALAAREANLKSLSGVVMQHEMRTAAQAASERAELFSMGGPKSTTGRVIATPFEEDGVWATRFEVAPGRCRFETLVYRASADGWGASTWLQGQDGKLPDVRPAPTPAYIVTEDGRKRTAYHSIGSTALVTQQTAWPSVAERGPLNAYLLLSRMGRFTASRCLAFVLAVAGTPVEGMTDHLATPTPAARERYLYVRRLADAAIDGHGCVGIEYSVQDTPDVSYRTRLWLAEQYGFAPMRFERCRTAQSVPGVVTSEIRLASGYREVSPGVWLPQQSRETLVVTGADGKQELRRALLSIFHFLNTDPIDPAQFTARLPLGTFVQDTTGGPSLVGDVERRDAERLLQQDRKLWDAPGAPLIPPPAGPKP